MIALKAELARLRIKHAPLAKSLGISRPALSAICNHGHWLPSLNRVALQKTITAAVARAGGNTAGLFDAAQKVTPPRGNAVASVPAVNQCPQETEMLFRKTVLTQASRKYFELTANPFADPLEVADVYLSAGIRYTREAMWAAARSAGHFIAVVSESGGGKSVLREELEDRLQNDDSPVIIIKPYVMAMEDNDRTGKTLKVLHIAEAIMSAIATPERMAVSSQARLRQVHNALRDSARTGHRHVLIIEEAHSLPIPTLKHLKRLLELKDGMRPLISILLLGQTQELMRKLNENDPNVREVVQRIEIITHGPLDADLEQFLKHRFDRAGVPLARVFDNAAIDALRTRLTPTEARGTRPVGSMLYPLTVQNVLAAAMNAAAELGMPRVNADMVRSI